MVLRYGDVLPILVFVKRLTGPGLLFHYLGPVHYTSRAAPSPPFALISGTYNHKYDP